MSRSSRRQIPDGHVHGPLMRRRQLEPADKILSIWASQYRQHERTASQTSPRKDERDRDRRLVSSLWEPQDDSIASAEPRVDTRPETIPKNFATQDSMVGFLNQFLRAIETGCLEGRRALGTKYSNTPHAVSGLSARGNNYQPSGHARHSTEWETETLLGHIGDGPDIGIISYPCPFRRRNPAKFNIRDHESCARTAFDSDLGLKIHIITHHRRKPVDHQCQRCKLQFATEWALDEHMLLPKEHMCEVNISRMEDPEDGISERAERILDARDAIGATWSWEWIWRVLFPEDTEVPEPDFQPVVELVEVQQAFDEGQEALKATLREQLRLLLPGDVDNDYLNFLTGQLELVFDTHRVNVMKQALNSHLTPTNNRIRPNRRSRRSTLLQSLHRTTPPDPAAWFAPQTKPGARVSRVKRDSNNSNPERRHRDGQPNRSGSDADTDGDTPTQNHRGAFEQSITTGQPRDARDSGISISTSTGAPSVKSQCDLDEPGRCGSRDDARLPDVLVTARSINKQRTGTPVQYRVPADQRSGLVMNDRSRPELGIRATGNLRSDSGPTLPVDHSPRAGEAAGTEGARFSPKSFKQRVLRGGPAWV